MGEEEEEGNSVDMLPRGKAPRSFVLRAFLCLRFFIYLFLERGGDGREKDRKRNNNGDNTCNPGSNLDWELNW